MASDDVQHPALFKHIVGQLRADGFPQSQIDRFAIAWGSLKPGAHLPCPHCLFDGEEGRLLSLPEADGFEPVRCKRCKTLFNLPIP